MLLSTLEELNALLPANVLQQADSLLTLMEQTERSYIIPVTGRPLYDEVTSEYAKLMNGTAADEEGGKLFAESLLANENMGHVQPTKMQRLIKLLQVPLVYMTLANNPGLLSVSLNAGGMNAVSAEGYDAAGKDSREAFAKDCYLNAHRGMEQVLLFLEEDAKCERPAFLDKWMESSYFYKQNGLMVRTALEFDRYSFITESRETFLSLVPAIRNVQDNRLRPELGDRLTDAFIQYATFGEQPKPTETDGDESAEDGGEPSPETVNVDAEAEEKISGNKAVNEWERISASTDSDDAYLEDLRSYLPLKRTVGMTSGELYKLRTWRKALDYLRSALVYYVESGDKKLKRAESLNDAMSCLDRAKKFIAGNSAAFAGVIEYSPLFTPEEDVPGEGVPPVEESKPSAPCAGTDGYSGRGRTEFVHDPFGTFFS